MISLKLTPFLNTFKSTLFVLALVLTFASCKNDKTDKADMPNPDDQEILDHLEGEGYNLDDVEILDDFVVFEDDAGWDKASLLKSIRGMESLEVIPIDPDDLSITENDGELVDRQRGILETSVSSAVTKTRIADVKYYIRSSVSNDCGTAWVTAIVDGANRWNNLSYCRVRLTRTYSQSSAHIVWGSDIDTGMPSSHRNLSGIARAGFPSSGNVWKWISINDANDTWGSKLKTTMHEFGHCFGYRHTGTSDGFQIHGTPYTDNSSFMRQGTNTNPTFTTGDTRAARVYYPDSYSNPNTITVAKAWNGALRLRYKNSWFLSKPYYWIRVYRYSSGGSYLGYKDFQSRTSNSNGYHTLYWSGLSTGTTYRFAIRGYNFRRDVYSGRSSQYYVTL